MEILDKITEKARSASKAIIADLNEYRQHSSAKESAKNPQTFNEFKKEIDEFGKNLDVDPYMSFVVSYFKNKIVDANLDGLDRSDRLKIDRRTLGKEYDVDILKYCFDYSDKDILTLTKTYKDYILDKDLVRFCMDKLQGSMSKGENLRIPQCTIPTFVLYNTCNYKFLIDYAKFESQRKYKALGEILTSAMGTKLLDSQTRCTSSILISPRVFIDEKDEMIRELKTDTQFIEEELNLLDKKGSLFAILPATWLTKDEEAKRKLIASNKLATVVELPPYKMLGGKDLIWLHFKKEDRDRKDVIKIYETKKMQYSDEGNTSAEELQRKMNDCVPKLEDVDLFLKRFDDDNKRNTIDRLYGDYMRIIDTRFNAQASKDIKSIIKNDILMTLHFPSNKSGKEDFIKEESDILKEEKSLGEKIGRTMLTAFLESFVSNDLIKEEETKKAYDKLTLHDKIIYIAQQKPNNEFEGFKCTIKLQKFKYEVPEFVINTLFSMKDLGNFGAHKEKTFENSSTNRRDKCGNLKNSIISCSFDFLDVLQWYNKFLKEIEEENEYSLDQRDGITEDDSGTSNNKTPQLNTQENYEVYEDNGVKFCKYKDGSARFSSNYNIDKGAIIQILEIGLNKSSDSSEYKYFIKKCQPI